MSTSRLLALPAELRNNIYELSFTSDVTSCDLYEAKPPSSALLRACRQTNSEAKGLYAESCRHYWSTTLFTSSEQLRREGRTTRQAHLSGLRRRGVLGLIRHLEVAINNKNYITKLHLELSDSQPVWKIKECTTRRETLEVNWCDHYFAIVSAGSPNGV